MVKWFKKAEVAPCFHLGYINDGYRSSVECGVWEAFISMFAFHNETMNIWSHFLGFICVLIAGVDIFIGKISHDTPFVESLMLLSYIACAATCLFLSSLYHLFNCLGESSHKTLLKWDLSGIAFLVAGSFFPGCYYGFYCLPDAQYLHLCLSGLVLVIGLIAPWVELKVNNRSVRPYIFAALVVFGLFPYIHWMLVTPSEFQEKLGKGFFLLFVFYSVGFFFFMSQFPEKFFPNSLIATQILSSHTLWHVCVVGAVFAWLEHILTYHEFMKESGYTCDAYVGRLNNGAAYNLDNRSEKIIYDL